MSTQNQRKAKETTGLAVGQPAPLFTATDQHDEPFELQAALAQRGKREKRSRAPGRICYHLRI